jgi:excisionase family DNA binding protein
MLQTTERILKTTLKADNTIPPEHITAALAALRGSANRVQRPTALLLSQAETAATLGCSRFTVRKLEKSGKLVPIFLTGDLKRFRRADVEAIATGLNNDD